MTEWRAADLIKRIKVEETAERYVDRHKAFDLAIKALEEIQQYREIGTVEEFNKALENVKTLSSMYEKLNDQEVKEYHRLSEYEDLEAQGKLLKLPCAVGDTVYVLAECEDIPAQLDGTLWDSNGGMGTATGYYCPYENNCPFDDDDFKDCEKYKKQTAVFEDAVKSITYDECGVWIGLANCSVYSQIGRYIFITKEEAEAALKEMMEQVS